MSKTNGAKALTREDIFGTRRTRKVEVEEWDGNVWVQSLPFSLANSLLARATESVEEGEPTEFDVGEILDDLLIHGVLDADGNRIFSEDDREQIGNLPFRPAMNLAMEVMDISGLTEQAEAELEGN